VHHRADLADLWRIAETKGAGPESEDQQFFRLAIKVQARAIQRMAS
jgi:hypothetical protein